MLRCILYAACVLAAASSAPGQCCSPAAAGHYEQRGGYLVWVADTPGKPQSVSADGWFRHEDGHVELWREGKIVEHASPGGERWREIIATIPPHARAVLGIVPAPPRPADCHDSACPLQPAAGDDPFPGGVNEAKLTLAPAYQINGRTATKAMAHRALQAGLEDDRAKSFLTAVLPDSQRQQFLTDLENHPALQPWRAKLHVNAYAPTDWHVSQIGLAEGISYQGPPDAQGKSLVRFRSRAYAGPEALAQALREADRNYRPDADPDPAKPKPLPAPSPDSPDQSLDNEQITSLGAGGLALLSTGVWVLRRRYFGA